MYSGNDAIDNMKDKIRKELACVNCNYVASDNGYSSKQTNRIFSAQTGMNLGEYIRYRRLAQNKSYHITYIIEISEKGLFNMVIHVVKQGETITSIANIYNVNPERLILDNGINNPGNLVIGQTIVILFPIITYIIQEGDTLGDIAQRYQVTLMQLLRNNPYLSERGYLIPGETIVITYETNIRGTLSTGGFVYPYVSETTLRMTLPFLTYLTIFNYQITQEGELVDIEDSNIVRLAKEYGVAPMMMVSTIDERSTETEVIDLAIFKSEELQNKLIDNILRTLEIKGYYGLNLYLQYLPVDYQTRIE